ncbi:MAG: hypothetical protein ACRCT6_11575 [Notoacmeibacter sp.]
MLILHYSPGACSLAPHVLLHETAIPFEKVLTSTADGTTKSDAWKKSTPRAAYQF